MIANLIEQANRRWMDRLDLRLNRLTRLEFAAVMALSLLAEVTAWGALQ